MSVTEKSNDTDASNASNWQLSIAHKCSSKLEHNQKEHSTDVSIYESINAKSLNAEQRKALAIRSAITHQANYRKATIASGGTYASIERKNSDRPLAQIGGGIRGNTYGMSYASRKRLLNAMAKLDRCSIDQKEVLFVTLTYDEKTSINKLIRGREYKRHLKNITQAITREYGGFGVWRFELQKRLVGHLHFVWYKVRYICHEWLARRWNEITGGSEKHLQAGVQVEASRSWKGTAIYGSKTMAYVAKDESTYEQRDHMKDIHIGRVWGICNRQEYENHIELREVDVTEKAHTQLLREYRKLQKSWRCRKGDYKGWKQMKRWMGSWMKLDNLKIEFYMENDAFDKLVSYSVNVDKRSKQKGFDRMEDRVRFSRLDMWRMRHGYGTFAV